jgi:UDP-N-acetylglucosamine 2-epimerase (non-hydrolysing)
MIGKMLIRIERTLQREWPDIVLVEGDTNSVLAGTLAACKLNIKVGHIEAGCRSFDKSMPEEINRILSDHASDYLFAPTFRAKKNLLNEGIAEKRVFVVGSTIVDALKYAKTVLKDIEIPHNLQHTDYFIATLHRQENVDVKERLVKIIKGLELVAKEFKTPLIFPVHPRTKKNLSLFNIMVDENALKLIEPMDYLTFIKVLSNSKLVLTDSGGVQQEACILKVPCVTLRYSTEWFETVEIGANILAGIETKKILKAARLMMRANKKWANPFGDGQSGWRIVRILKKELKSLSHNKMIAGGVSYN